MGTTAANYEIGKRMPKLGEVSAKGSQKHFNRQRDIYQKGTIVLGDEKKEEWRFSIPGIKIVD